MVKGFDSILKWIISTQTNSQVAMSKLMNKSLLDILTNYFLEFPILKVP